MFSLGRASKATNASTTTRALISMKAACPSGAAILAEAALDFLRRLP